MANIKNEKHSKKVDEEYYTKVGRKLGEIREGIGYTQRNVALALGITFQQYQKYESGVNRIPTKALAQFCELTGSDIREIAGVTLEDYEIRYKQNIVNNYSSTYINNYNGLFSNLFNMDLRLMKNRIALVTITLAIIVIYSLNLIKIFFSIPSTSQWVTIILSFQMLAICISFSLILFMVYRYSKVTYIISYFTYTGIWATVYRFFWYPERIFNDNIDRFLAYAIALVLTFLTFYILKKLKVNVPTKEEGPAVIDTRRQKAGVPE